MAKTSKADIKELSNDELVQKISDEKMRYRKLRFNHKVSQLDNPLVLRNVRRDIARYITEMKKREMAEDATNTSEQA